MDDTHPGHSAAILHWAPSICREGTCKALESHGPISGNSYVCLRPPPSFHFMRPDTARSSRLAWARKFLFGFLRKFGGEYSIWQPSACQHSPVCELFS